MDYFINPKCNLNNSKCNFCTLDSGGGYGV